MAPASGGTIRSEVARVADLDPDVADEATRASRTLFQTPEHGMVLSAAGGEPLLVRALDDAGRPLGHALVLEETILGFRRWTCPDAPAPRKGTSPDAPWRALVEAGRARGVVSASWRDPTSVRLDPRDIEAAQDACARAGGASRLGRFVAFTLDLTRPLDALHAGVHRKQRHAVRKAEAAGVVAQPCPRHEFSRAFHALSDETWRRSGAAGPPRAYFERLAQAPWALPYLARDENGVPVAGALVTRWRRDATYLHGASADEGAPGASALLQWTIVRDLQSAGARAYDLGGGPLPDAPDDTPRQAGIRRFKASFGGEARPWPSLHLTLDPQGYEAARAAVRDAAAQRQKE